MDPSFSDSSKSHKMTMEEKRELVYELSKWPDGAPEILQSWSRQEILQILCAESGKDRKYTGLTKLKIIENLLKLVSEKKSADHELDTEQSSQKSSKRQKKNDIPSRIPIATNNNIVNSSNGDPGNPLCCGNSACRAKMKREDAFCKRCSCCICYQYDDNKDPSLWLSCSSEFPFQAESCGLSCHLDCAFRHKKSGIGKEDQQAIHDGSFCCVSCGKMNDLIGCWRKQLMMAKETRRVDILCYRVSLCLKLLRGTKRYQKLYEIVEQALLKLEADVGPLTGLEVKTSRGIVNRLSSGPAVQQLCTVAVDLLDELLSNTGPGLRPIVEIQNSSLISSNVIRFESVCATCFTVIVGFEDLVTDPSVAYCIWYRKANDKDYPTEPTYKISAPNTKFFMSGLTPNTEYMFKLVSFNGARQSCMSEVGILTSVQDEGPKSLEEVERSESPTTNGSSLSNPSSVEDESTNLNICNIQHKDRVDNYHDHCKTTDKKIVSSNLCGDDVLDEERAMEINVSKTDSDVVKLENKLSLGSEILDMNTDNINIPVQVGMECVPFVRKLGAELPITPSKLESVRDGQKRKVRSKHSHKDLDIESDKKSSDTNDRDFEYYVKVIRWLECEGHIETNFRQKFLTWYSLKATPQEVRIVKVFVDTFREDPASLAGQLIDTFSEFVSSKRSIDVPSGFCMKLWH